MPARRCVQDEDDIELKDAQRIQLSRTLLVKWITEPFFADTVQGCLIRGRAVDGFWIASVADVEVREPGPCKYAALSKVCCLLALPACGFNYYMLSGLQPAAVTAHGVSKGRAWAAAWHDVLLLTGCKPVAAWLDAALPCFWCSQQGAEVKAFTLLPPWPHSWLSCCLLGSAVVSGHALQAAHHGCMFGSG